MGLINKLFRRSPVEKYSLKCGGHSMSAYFGVLSIRVPTWAKHWSVDPYGSLVVWENAPEYDNFSMDFEAEGKCRHMLRFENAKVVGTAKGELYNV